MIRGLLLSLVLHLGAGYLFAFGLPSVSLKIPGLDEFDLEIELVNAIDDAPILASLDQTETRDQPPPEPELIETPSAADLLQEMLERPAAEPDPLPANVDQQRLDAPTNAGLELDVDTADFDPTQESSLGRGSDGPQSADAPDADTDDRPIANEDISLNDVEENTGPGGDADALAEVIERLTNTGVDDTSPVADPDDFGTNGTQTEEPQTDEAQQTENVEDLRSEAGGAGPTDENAESEFASIAIPKMRPRQPPSYIDPQVAAVQDNLAPGARLEIQPAVEADADVVADVDNALSIPAQLIDDAVTQSQSNASVVSDAQSAAAVLADKDAILAAASQRIRNRFQDLINWPIFVRAQDGWKALVKVELVDENGEIKSVDVSVIVAPPNASADAIRTVVDAVEGGIWASQPWEIPLEYVDDWLILHQFVLCPQTSAVTAQAAC